MFTAAQDGDDMAIRDLILRNGFAHRLNKGGTADSICLFCNATVTSSTIESELAGAEAIHNCWQTDRGRNQAPQLPMRPRAEGAIGLLFILAIGAVSLAVGELSQWIAGSLRTSERRLGRR